MGHEVNGPGEGNVAQGTGNMCYQFRLNCAHEATSIGQSVSHKECKTNNCFSGVYITEEKEIHKHANSYVGSMEEAKQSG